MLSTSHAHQALLADQPSTSTGQSELRTKIRPKDNRTRANPAEAYPQSRVTRTQSLRDVREEAEQAEANSTSKETSGSGKKHSARGPDGRFARKRPEDKP